MNHLSRPLALTTLLILLGALAAEANTVVRTCGQTVRGPAVLRANLDCSEFGGDAVIVYGGPLSLGGFAVTGHPAHSVISCRGTKRSVPGGASVGPCTIQGPGTVVGGMRGIHSGQLKVTDVDVTGSMMGIASLQLKMNGGSVTACRLAGVAPWGAPAKHRVRNATISGNTTGIWPQWWAADGGFLIEGSSIIDNIGNGLLIDTPLLTIRNSTITGNGLDPTSAACTERMPVGGQTGCGDVLTSTEPVIDEGSICGTSLEMYGPGSWGSCAGD
jgi:hypothetical protein